jgi:redox-sensing transcriptional repressor
MDRLEPVVKELGVQVAILTVPGSEAKEVAAKLVRLGIRGILNFAPVPLHLPAGIYVENIDLTTSLEKVAYFSRNTINGNSGKEEGGL